MISDCKISFAPKYLSVLHSDLGSKPESITSSMALGRFLNLTVLKKKDIIHNEGIMTGLNCIKYGNYTP